MATRMLIDARHSEETRVAVLKGNRIEEFDFESAEHKQIKGNIYLAKVTRVEPSLQAAFVDFGGNRHGFLAFSEIHPDYYQIPKEDREALLADEAEAAEEEARLRAEEEDEGYVPGDEYDAEDESAEALAEDLAEDGMEEIDTSEKDHVST
ncbi:MAG: S1 RNA-binding domain-containing protein, partial [Pontixanthobacter sp.]